MVNKKTPEYKERMIARRKEQWARRAGFEHVPTLTNRPGFRGKGRGHKFPFSK